ncbi:hypothetical protein [Sphaerisporangium sp. TRM90804]|uniref:hypothetical protein n=1 Tax=Sphaerisporangium sp. TRM90804 TaxID=3031113 RepID=UPI00244B594D|nr:hypothetical protein [Sphaerisporangium sp. TRM90804]MDH2429279.1 hypothetical protein [Sphaerisporangium sp. TRM90804]
MARVEPSIPAMRPAVTLAGLQSKYGMRWDISDGISGGWVAVRRHCLPGVALARGLSNVRCAATLDELASHLAAETRIEDRPRVPGEH